MTNPNARDNAIQQAQQERMFRDTKIMQKVNMLNREAFKTRFPGQIEHCMRLVAERLQAMLVNKPEDLTNPTTWAASPKDIHDLVSALDMLAHLNHGYPIKDENVQSDAQ